MTTAREAKDRLYDQFARLAQALASPKRLEILDLLCQSEKPVDALAKQTSLSTANTSRHLQVMRSACLVETRKEGLHIYYRLADEEVCKFFRSLRRLADLRLAEIDRIVADFFGNSQSLHPINRKELLKRAKAGEVVVLDVRPRDEYLAGHIAHARSIPLEELDNHIDEFSPDQEIIAYCRGPYCVLAQEAVKKLNSMGFNAVRLEDGVAEWREAGMKVVSQ